MGGKFVALVALASYGLNALASPAPRPIPRPLGDGGPAMDNFGWKAGAGVHLVECRPRDAEEGSAAARAEQSWLSLVIVRPGY